MTEERERVNTLVMRWNSEACEPPAPPPPGSPPFQVGAAPGLPPFPPHGEDRLQGDPLG